MESSKVFRIKFTFQEQGEKSDKLVNMKSEVLAQCVNYTDAEALSCEIIKEEMMDRFGGVDVEIIKTKILRSDIVINRLLERFEKPMCGLIEYQADEDKCNLFTVEIKVLPNAEEKSKGAKYTYLVPASHVSQATSIVKEMLIDMTSDYVVKCVKIDNATAIFVKQESDK